MTRLSHSRVECFKKCPYQFKLRYVDKTKTIPNQDPTNALYLGTGIHEGIEKGLKHGIKSYFENYYLINDNHINETIKFEYLIPMVKKYINDLNTKVMFERKIETEDFIGFIDLLTKNEDGTYDIYDFKYSNNIDVYKESSQLHLYKYFLELTTDIKVNKMYFLFVPKVAIRQKYKNKTNKKDEELYEFRNRIMENLRQKEIQIVEIKYNPNKVIGYLIDAKHLIAATEYPKNPSYLCGWCEYKDYCERGIDYMLLPKNERRERKIDRNPDMWIYADSYVGKSTFVDKFDDLLFINTDGNTDNTTSPVITIADEVKVEGRRTIRIFAWEKFLEVVEELEKKDNDFKRVCIDLVEDLYEHCRLYTYDRLNIEHEQDAGYGKGWDMVRTEYFSAIKRLKHLGYQIIYISKEVVGEINLKSGGKITAIKPNIADRLANVLAGTVDLTVRAYMDEDERFLQLEKKENVFGGGRFDFKVDEITLDTDEFIKALEEAQEGFDVREKEVKEDTVKNVEEPENEEPKNKTRKTKEEATEEKEPQIEETPVEKEEPGKRKRRSRKNEEEQVENTDDNNTESEDK